MSFTVRDRPPTLKPFRNQGPESPGVPISMVELSRPDIERYARHIIMPEVGPRGQQKLKEASVLIVGAGGLGSPAALYLAAAGIGRLGIADFDNVELSNLQRQVLFDDADVGLPKVEVAARRLAALSPHLQVDQHPVRVDSSNALALFEGYDVILDGSDNFPTRYLTNDACVLAGKPLAYGAVHRFEGQASLFHARQGPCYRCLFPTPPPPELAPSCAESGVLGILPGLIGAIQATEALKFILGLGRSLAGRLLLYDALNMDFREVRVPRNPACPICSDDPTITELIDYELFCGDPPASC